MKSLKDSIYESIETSDREALNSIYGLEKVKLNSGTPVYWANASELASCYLPGKGKVTKAAMRAIKSDLESFFVKTLKLDETPISTANGKLPKENLTARIHVISGQANKAKAQKDENPLDYAIIIAHGVNGADAVKNYDQNKFVSKIARATGCATTDILVESEGPGQHANYKAADGGPLEYQYYYYSVYLGSDNLEALLNKI